VTDPRIEPYARLLAEQDVRTPGARIGLDAGIVRESGRWLV
jgi:hypothetical protein